MMFMNQGYALGETSMYCLDMYMFANMFRYIDEYLTMMVVRVK